MSDCTQIHTDLCEDLNSQNNFEEQQQTRDSHFQTATLPIKLLEKEMAVHCSILAWRIPWIPMDEPGRLQSTGRKSWTRLSD